MNRVSVALCTFNGETHIWEQLQSLANQNCSPYEIIVSDDGSTDRTIEMVGEFARSSPGLTIHIIRQTDRVGYRENFMRAAAACSGDYIAFCDQDDVWKREKLEIARATLVQSGANCFYHNLEITGPDLEVKGTKYGLTMADRIYEQTTLSPWDFPLGLSMVFRAELLRFSSFRLTTIDPYDTSQALAHDQWIAFLANSLGRIAYCSKALVSYRQHGGNTFGQTHTSESLTSFSNRLRARFFRYSDYAVLASAANTMAEVLNQIDLSEAAKSATQFTRLAQAYEVRAQCYHGDSLFTRLASWATALNSRFYDADSAISFANKSLLRDLGLGCFCTDRLRLSLGQFNKHDNSLRLGGVSGGRV